MPDDCECGCPKKSHRYGGANIHGAYDYYSSCRRCDCDQYTHPERGAIR